MIKKSIAIIAIAAAATSSAIANGKEENFIYLGGGVPTKNGIGVSSDTPYSIGYLKLGNGGLLGFDIAGEGTTLDSTWGSTNSVEQAISVNFLVGKNFLKFASGRVDGSIIVGFRHKTKDCPKSFIGYQCYADQDPTVSFGLNYGALISVNYGRVLIGGRFTGESKQIVFGISF